MSGLRHRNVGQSSDSISQSSIMEAVKKFDAYSKPMEDFRVQTTSGAFLTLASAFFIAILIISEFLEYRSTTLVASMVVEKNRKDKLWIEMNITFPHVPCVLVGVDVMDVAGEQQNDISHSIFKVRLDRSGAKIAETKGEIGHAATPNLTSKALDASYCGDCYGGVPKPTEENPKGCCNTCDEVREAYQRKGWSFNRPEEVEQCLREGYVDKVKQQAGEGCNINGHVEVNRVAGNMHFAPGKSFQQAHMHVHDIHSFVQQQGGEGTKNDWSHVIHYLNFGKVAAFANPLDGIVKTSPDSSHMYQYFIKVVGTRFQYMNGSIVSTNQYSVTEHEKSTLSADGRGHVGLPGVFFNFEISPMTVIYAESRKSFGSFLTGVCAVVGGIFTVAGLVDSLIWTADTRLKKPADLLTKSS
ncbi:endoplasmic reticulum vesicle transporter-domain-containing protein [Hyaloraphidium curvatum]|nr:endoplasmic reticulum vesicle transporter-domain-containing protein [Hyaloraphidium curvatum]